MTANSRVAKLAYLSIIIALVVMSIKFLAWWLTGSVALLSDALESIVNVIAAAVASVAIRISHKPADTNHQYGHQKAEYFSAVLEGIFVVLAALAIFYSAYMALVTEHRITEPALGMAINAVAAIINGYWAWLLISTGTAEKSPALLADGLHVKTDVVTSIGVLIGLGLTIVTGWIVLDALMAMIVGVNVLREGWKVISSSINGLMDASIDADEAEVIEEIIIENAQGAIEVHDIKSRVSGAATYVEFHLVVDRSMDVKAAHDICDRIEGAIQSAVPGSQTTIHVEPDHKQKGTGLDVS
uniref:cation diffusion facilitator family transporter n=1 Tax=Pararhizobium sp. IMCC3301 TaxID=3067904 RepID=UPI0027416B19|nr:cation diffusion facilitator family transporter [Pararhizobium sp. IMCC3301]